MPSMLASTGALCSVMVMSLVARLELVTLSLTMNPMVRAVPGVGLVPLV